MNRDQGALASRRTVAFFAVAVIFGLLVPTSRWWMPWLLAFLGVAEANGDLIGVLADLINIISFLSVPIGIFLAYLGFKRPRGPNTEREQQAINVSQEGRVVAISGDVKQGSVIVGDNNEIAYHYADVTDSATNSAPYGCSDAWQKRNSRPCAYSPDVRRSQISGESCSVFDYKRNTMQPSRLKEGAPWPS